MGQPDHDMNYLDDPTRYLRDEEGDKLISLRNPIFRNYQKNPPKYRSGEPIPPIGYGEITADKRWAQARALANLNQAMIYGDARGVPNRLRGLNSALVQYRNRIRGARADVIVRILGPDQTRIIWQRTFPKLIEMPSLAIPEQERYSKIEKRVREGLARIAGVNFTPIGRTHASQHGVDMVNRNLLAGRAATTARRGMAGAAANLRGRRSAAVGPRRTSVRFDDFDELFGAFELDG